MCEEDEYEVNHRQPHNKQESHKIKAQKTRSRAHQPLNKKQKPKYVQDSTKTNYNQGRTKIRGDLKWNFYI